MRAGFLGNPEAERTSSPHKYGKPTARLDDSAVQALRAERWPGNVRELQNFVERLVVLATGVIRAEDVRREMGAHVEFKTQLSVGASAGRVALSAIPETSPSGAVSLDEAVKRAEKQAIERALREGNGNRTIAARILGVSRTTLYAKLEEYGIG